MRSTFFKGGHRPTFTWLEGGRSDEGADGEGVKVWERLPQVVYEIAKTEFPSTPCVLRPVNSSVDPWGDGASLDVHTQAESREQCGEMSLDGDVINHLQQQIQRLKQSREIE